MTASKHSRLLRLPSVRTTAAATAATAGVAAATAAFTPLWPVAIAAGAAGIATYLHRNRARVSVERRMIKALRVPPLSTTIPTLTAEVHAETTHDGVTRITAATWLDAVRALGYVTARDRAFHLDLMRRTAQGRLAEVSGRVALPSDRRFRPLALAKAAEHAKLDTQERDLLTAFAEGVNAAGHIPFESRFLSYRPAPWTVEDSVTLALFLYHGLSWNAPAKHAENVIRQSLPADVAAFFLPGGPADVPDALTASPDPDPSVIEVDSAIPGSNCWVARGGAGPVVGCDLHLPLTMPNLMYEVDISWPGHRLRGLTAPGVPAVLTGTNGHIAWGVTNLTADVIDLLPPKNPTVHTERIRVRGRKDEEIQVTTDQGMPVIDGYTVRWAGHDPRAADLRFQRLAHAESVEEAIAVLDDADGIALNVLVADNDHMAHLATGLLPRRTGAGPADGYLTGPERPRSIDPDDGILVSANDQALPEEPFRIGYNSDPGHRARRARDVLSAAEDVTPETVHDLQHDTRADIYLPYRDLAVAELGPCDLADTLKDWDGHADTTSRAVPVLVVLRDLLAKRVLSPYLTACRERDENFRYPFRAFDRPLLAILRAGLAPDGTVAACAREAADIVKGATWGEVNAIGMTHPLTALAPWAAPLLNVAPRPEAGGLHSVRVAAPGFAAVGRAVLTPGGHAEFETPAGQSGHPLSPHHTDRHHRWSTGTAPPTGPGRAFTLRPGDPPPARSAEGDETHE